MPSVEILPLVTIITPTFNAGSCIEKCIQSVVSQTYTDIEHLIMDGGSTDNTLSVVRRYQRMYPHNIRLISEQDTGIYDAMNKGVKNAKGEWLFFLGADDFLFDNNVLQNVRQHLSDATNEFVYGNVWMERMNRVYDGAFDVERLLKHNICHQAVFYRSSVFSKLGLYNIRYKIQADYDFNLRCTLTRKVVIKYIPEIIAFHSGGGISAAQEDYAFVQDYPSLIVKYIFEGNYSSIRKIDMLAKIYRKLILRYPVKELLKHIFNIKHLLYKCLAVMWMPFGFLFNKKLKLTNQLSR